MFRFLLIMLSARSLPFVFPVPLKQNESFRVAISCRWDGAFTRSRTYDYAFSSWNSYAVLGVDRQAGCVVSDVPLSHFVLERLEDGRRTPDPIQPLQLDAQPHVCQSWRTP
jgi:hypothetical protein